MNDAGDDLSNDLGSPLFIVGRRMLQLEDPVTLAIFVSGQDVTTVGLQLVEAHSGRIAVETSQQVGPRTAVAHLLADLRSVTPGSYELNILVAEMTFRDTVPIVIVPRETYLAWMYEAAAPTDRPIAGPASALVSEVRMVIHRRMLQLLHLTDLRRVGHFTSEGVFAVDLRIDGSFELPADEPEVELDPAVWTAEFLLDEVIYFAAAVRLVPEFSVLRDENGLELRAVLSIRDPVSPMFTQMLERAQERLNLVNIREDLPDYRATVSFEKGTLAFSVALRHRVNEMAMLRGLT